MKVSVIKSKMVCSPDPYFVGVSWSGDQVRIGLIFWHFVFIK